MKSFFSSSVDFQVEAAHVKYASLPGLTHRAADFLHRAQAIGALQGIIRGMGTSYSQGGGDRTDIGT